MIDIFCCPYCHGDLIFNGNYMCQSCNLIYKYKNDIYYFYNPGAKHWKKVSYMENHLREITNNPELSKSEKEKTYGTYQFYENAPYDSADYQLSSAANCALLNYSFEMMRRNLVESDGYIIVIGARSLWESYFLARYKHVLAIDISDDIRYINPKFKNGITRIVCDGMFLPIRESVADLIFMNATFHHMEYKDIALNNWYRVLKENGIVVANGEYYCQSKDLGIQDDIGEYAYTYEMFHKLINESEFAAGALFPIRYSGNMQYKMGIDLTGNPDNGIILIVKS